MIVGFTQLTIEQLLTMSNLDDFSAFALLPEPRLQGKAEIRTWLGLVSKSKTL